MKTSDLIKSNWLRAVDLNGEAITYTIKKVTLEGIGKPAVEKPVLWFNETSLGLVLNKTNVRTLEDLLGNETDDWPDQKVNLVPTLTEFSGKQVECIRLQPALEKKAVAHAQLQPGDEF